MAKGPKRYGIGQSGKKQPPPALNAGKALPIAAKAGLPGQMLLGGGAEKKARGAGARGGRAGKAGFNKAILLGLPAVVLVASFVDLLPSRDVAWTLIGYLVLLLWWPIAALLFRESWRRILAVPALILCTLFIAYAGYRGIEHGPTVLNRAFTQADLNQEVSFSGMKPLEIAIHANLSGVKETVEGSFGFLLSSGQLQKPLKGKLSRGYVSLRKGWRRRSSLAEMETVDYIIDDRGAGPDWKLQLTAMEETLGEQLHVQITHPVVADRWIWLAELLAFLALAGLERFWLHRRAPGLSPLSDEGLPAITWVVACSLGFALAYTLASQGMGFEVRALLISVPGALVMGTMIAWLVSRLHQTPRK